ncbi:hypothetical protein SAMN02910357_00748 [Succinivibrio dextrinosolvens]|uniref:hypothetical protein n=1 Tax=Succinivibrio dextrinosolvens TaxID=83771 RepID=UPI0008F20260|nr:hypothetical protein [Succinivibrio dextrinosolvens]SFS43831.1 hypothetical protein SAMN02910357_00748 [Succinivibrio dextrinosolvens]
MVKEYIDFINNHYARLVYEINREVDDRLEELRNGFIKEIYNYLTPDMPVHYEEDHTYDPPYDCSGELVEAGKISADITVNEFLEEEYNGDKHASYCSGCGFFHDTYSDSLQSFTLEYGVGLMHRKIREILDKELKVELSDEEFEEIYREMGCFDEIYVGTKIYDFFCPEIVAQMCGIDKLKLSEVIQLTEKSDDFIIVEEVI